MEELANIFIKSIFIDNMILHEFSYTVHVKRQPYLQLCGKRYYWPQSVNLHIEGSFSHIEGSLYQYNSSDILTGNLTYYDQNHLN